MSLEPVEENKFDDDISNEIGDQVIDWGVFTKSLVKITDEDIKCVMVLSSSGTLLSSYGVESKSAKRIIPPLLTSIWKITSNVGKKFVDARGLELMFINCEIGRIALSAVIPDDAPFFICLLANNDMELGLLKVKIELITDQLAKILFNEQDDEDEEDDGDINDGNNTANKPTNELQNDTLNVDKSGL